MLFRSSTSTTIWEGVSQDFIIGADISSVNSLINSGVKFYDFDGNETDLVRLLADNGVNCIRIRIWNDPFDNSADSSSERNGYGGGNCDIDNAVKIARQAAACGVRLLLDFHYSDFWADPERQTAPKAWKDYTLDQKTAAVSEWTTQCLAKIKETSADIAMVQIGNEINNGLCGETDNGAKCTLINAGASAVRSFDKNIKVAVHFTNPEKQGNLNWYAGILKQNNVDYDIFAVSYYPFWHGTLSNLKIVLTQIKSRYGKDVMVAETSYPYTYSDSDQSGNVINADSTELQYEVSPAGQAAAWADLVETIDSIGGLGVFYWEPAWIGVGSVWNENVIKWRQFGSGWASEYAASYDKNVTKTEGSSWDNQAVFDKDGKPLESIKMFKR